MSAHMSVKFADSIQLFADGAAYNPEGVVTSFEDKIKVGRIAPVAIAVRGMAGFSLNLASFLCEATDREGIEKLLNTLRGLKDSLYFRRASKEEEATGFDFLIALWHPTEGPKHYRLHNVPTLPGFAPFVLHEIGDFIACGAPFAAQTLFDRKILPVTGRPTKWAQAQGVKIMELMRNTPGEPLPGLIDPHPYRIGGHVDLATVTKTGVVLRRVKRWNDKVGERIMPTSINQKEEWLGNRQQRRRLRKAG